VLANDISEAAAAAAVARTLSALNEAGVFPSAASAEVAASEGVVFVKIRENKVTPARQSEAVLERPRSTRISSLQRRL